MTKWGPSAARRDGTPGAGLSTKMTKQIQLACHLDLVANIRRKQCHSHCSLQRTSAAHAARLLPQHLDDGRQVSLGGRRLFPMDQFGHGSHLLQQDICISDL